MAVMVREKEWEFFDPTVPWKHFQSIDELGHITHGIGEAVFGVCTLVALIHAVGHDRQHVLVWIAAVTSGTANDILFMIMPFVDNFFHAQFMVMLTPRLPLYILFAYINFQYAAAVGSWRLGLPPIAQAAAAALSGSLYYAIYDVTGVKFLWWTWHDTDAAISERWLGVPIGSTMWTLVHQFIFNLLLHYVALKYKKLSLKKFFTGLFIVTFMCTPLMMIAMGPFQLLEIDLNWMETNSLPIQTKIPGKPDIQSISQVIILFVFLIIAGISSRKSSKQTSNYKEWFSPSKNLDYFLYVGVLLHFFTLVCVMSLFDPAEVVGTGMHQEYGNCDVKEVDLMGFERRSFLCKENFDEDFHFDCPAAAAQELPPSRPSWFTICGKAFTDQRRYIGATMAISLLGITSFTIMLVGSSESKRDHTKRE